MSSRIQSAGPAGLARLGGSMKGAIRFCLLILFLGLFVYLGNKVAIKEEERKLSEISSSFTSKKPVVVIRNRGRSVESEYIINEAWENGYRLVSHVVLRGDSNGLREEVMTFELMDHLLYKGEL